MSDTFLGVSYFVWGFVCLAIATLYLFIWPKAPGRVRTRWVHIVLRYFHALVWLLLAATCFLRIVSSSANILGLISLMVYLIFIMTALLERRGRL